MRITTLMVLVLMLSLTVGASAAEWVSLEGSKTPANAPGVLKVLETGIDGTKLELNLEGYLQDNVKLETGEYQALTIPGGSLLMEKGMPELPKFTAFVTVPAGVQPKIKVLEEDVVTVKLEQSVISSKGHITRNVDPKSVPHTFASVYDVDAYWPAQKVEIGKTFAMRDLTGARVELHPVRFNAQKKELQIARRMVIQIDTAGAAEMRAMQDVPRVFENIYKSAFLNYEQWPTRATRVVTGKLLIVTLDTLAEAVAPYVEWKKKIGWDVTLVNLSTIGTTADELKAFIQSKYDEGGLAYIMLVGDYPEMPTLFGLQERAASDPCFTKLAGNDNIPDACIGRISAKTAEEVENQVAKFVHYEQFPMTGDDAAWYGKGMGIASSEGNPTDYARANWLRDPMLAWNFTHVDQIYDPGANAQKVLDGVNDGRSVINYIGHGSSTQWVTSRFTNSNVDQLANGRKFPVIWSVACQNGRFTMSYGDCFCERWLKVGTKDDPKGSVAIFGASTNAAWVPPCDMQSEIIKEQMIGGKNITVGGQYLQGILKGMEIWGTSDSSQGNQLSEQYCLFGDVTLVLRTKAPAKVDLATEREGDTVRVAVTVDGKPLDNAMVTVATERNQRTAVTGAEGKVSVSFNADEAKDGVLVNVYAQDIIPVTDHLVK